MTTIGTALTPNATRVMLLGSGELGKEIVIECQKLGIETIAIDRYCHAPAMQVAHRSYVRDISNAKELESIISEIDPDYIVPEIEYIDTNFLVEIENLGKNVVPSAQAVHITTNRKRMRKFAAEFLKLPTSRYKFANNKNDFIKSIREIGVPCIVKPIVGSSGKGQSIIHKHTDLDFIWNKVQLNNPLNEVIIENLINFDSEITIITVSAFDGIHYCEPIGHYQYNGNYQKSWQPHTMSNFVLEKSKNISRTVVSALQGHGVFGVELFVVGDDVIFNEVSSRPHDTGLVTLMSQNLSEFALHVRAFLNLPIGNIKQYGPTASVAIISNFNGKNITFSNLSLASKSNSQIRLFGKRESTNNRRLGVVLASANNIKDAIGTATFCVKNILISSNQKIISR